MFVREERWGRGKDLLVGGELIVGRSLRFKMVDLYLEGIFTPKMYNQLTN